MAPERARAAALQGGKASRPPLRKINLIGTLIFNRSEKKKKIGELGKMIAISKSSRLKAGTRRNGQKEP